MARVRDSAGRIASKDFRLTIAGRSDLAIHLAHRGKFRHGRTGRYRIKVTNTGTAAPGTILSATAVVVSSDATPADNVSTNLELIRVR